MTPEQRRFVIMQRFGNNYKKECITYQQDPDVKMYVSHKLHQFSRINFLSRAKFIVEFDAKPILDSFARLKKVYEYRFLRTYHKKLINQYDFYLLKWIEPNNSFPFPEFEFEFDSSIPDKIINILKRNNEIANETPEKFQCQLIF